MGVLGFFFWAVSLYQVLFELLSVSLPPSVIADLTPVLSLLPAKLLALRAEWCWLPEPRSG